MTDHTFQVVSDRKIFLASLLFIYTRIFCWLLDEIYIFISEQIFIEHVSMFLALKKTQSP